MPKFIDLTGKRFGHFTVIERDFNYKKEKNLTSGTFWKVKCDCGNEKIINGAVLKRPGEHSCGCAKIKDLTNLTFGRLKVIKLSPTLDKKKRNAYWECQCECGSTIIVDSDSLQRGHVKSCGCLKKDAAKKVGQNNKKDLTGQTFGKLTVLKDSGERKESFIIWECLCSCGTKCKVSSQLLLRGSTKSCGCLRKEVSSNNIKKNKLNLKGMKFGKLQVLEETDKRTSRGAVIWKCLCECQTISYVSSTALFTGRIQSCGCVRSRGEEKITKILNEKNISFQKEYSFENLINPKTGRKLRFDFALFNNKNKLICLIEFDGYQHFLTDSKGYYTKEKILDLKYRDNLKNDYCKNNKIKLIRISYKDYNKLDWNFLEEKINERF